MPHAAQYRKAAHQIHHDEGALEIDEGAQVNPSPDGGAYVQAWVWVEDEEAASREAEPDSVDYDVKAGACPECHAQPGADCESSGPCWTWGVHAARLPVSEGVARSIEKARLLDRHDIIDREITSALRKPADVSGVAGWLAAQLEEMRNPLAPRFRALLDALCRADDELLQDDGDSLLARACILARFWRKNGQSLFVSRAPRVDS